MNAIRSHSITFFVDNLFVFRVVSPEEWYCLLHFKCIFEALINLPLIITLLSKNEGCRVRWETAVVRRIECTSTTGCGRIEKQIFSWILILRVECISEEPTAGDGLSTDTSGSCNWALGGIWLEELARSCTWTTYSQMIVTRLVKELLVVFVVLGIVLWCGYLEIGYPS